MTDAVSKKKIIAMVEKGTNYIFHLMAIAKLGFDSDYSEKYRNSVRPEDIEYLQQHRELLSFGSGTGGQLVNVLIFLPAYLEIETVNDFTEYFRLIDVGFQKGNYQPFFTRYSDPIERLREWIDPFEVAKLQVVLPYRQIIAEAGMVYQRNLGAYERHVWPIEKGKMDRVAGCVNEYTQEHDLIATWENLVGLTFKFPQYIIGLCSAIKNGPNANSLGYERNVFYYENLSTQFISHEVGTHLFIDIYKELLASGQYEQILLYDAYENLSKFYNTLILGKDELTEYQINSSLYSDQDFYKVFRRIYKHKIGISPKDLLIEGLEVLLSMK